MSESSNRDVTLAHTDSAAFGKATNKALGVSDQPTIVLKDWRPTKSIVLCYCTLRGIKYENVVKNTFFENALKNVKRVIYYYYLFIIFFAKENASETQKINFNIITK